MDICEDCPSNDVIDEYVLNRLPPDTRAAFEGHLQRCSRCADEVDLTRKLIEGLRAATDPQDSRLRVAIHRRRRVKADAE